MFTMLVLPNGKTILTTHDTLSAEQMADLTQVWEEWKNNPNRDLLVVGQCEVRLIEDVSLRLGDDEGGNVDKKTSQKTDEVRTEEVEGTKSDLPAKEAMPATPKATEPEAAPKSPEAAPKSVGVDTQKRGW